MFKYFDIHSHIHGKEYEPDRGDVLIRMRENGVGAITVGTYLESSKEAVFLSERESDVWSAVGLHPTDTEEIFDYKSFKELALNKRVVAIGECGLDYYRLTNNKQLTTNDKDLTKEKERQKRILLQQIELSIDVDKPLMIHCRPSGKTMDAHEDMIEILTTYNSQLKTKRLRGNIHFFTGTLSIARKYFDLGFTVSFSGVITFADEYKNLILNCPTNMIMSETDSPYASPVPHRGKRNEPSYVLETVRRIASILDKTEEAVAFTTVQNAGRVFEIPI